MFALTKTYSNDFLIHTNFLTMIAIGLFCCCEIVLMLMNMWVIRKNSSLPEKEDFYSNLNMEDILLMQITRTQKEFVNTLK